MRFCLLALSLVYSLAGVAASAAPISYNLNFTGGTLTPTAGSFTFDPGNGVFTAFSIEWAGVALDFTSIANQPFFAPGYPCQPAETGAVQLYTTLINGCSGFRPAWEGARTSNGGAFYLYVFDSENILNGFAGNSFPSIIGSQLVTSGELTVTSQSGGGGDVPEPTTALLLPVGGAMLLAWRRRCSRRGGSDQ